MPDRALQFQAKPLNFNDSLVPFISSIDARRGPNFALSNVIVAELSGSPDMSVESAIAYIQRMHSDEEFRARMTILSDDEEASWAALREEGFEFTLSELKRGQEAYCQANDLIEK